MAKVLYLSGRSMNDALGAAGRAHRVLFEQLGLEYVEINFSDSGFEGLLNRCLTDGGVEFAYGAVGMGGDLAGTRSDGSQVNLWAASGIPYISVSGDSPAYFFQRHVALSPLHACLYYFPEHLEFRKRLSPAPLFSGTIPPVPFDPADKGSIDFRKKRSGQLLFLKNGNDPERLIEAWRKGVPEATFVMLVDMAGELSSDLASPVSDDLDALVHARFLHAGWDVERCLNLRLFFVAQLDDYLRRVKSQLVADAVADFPVVIQGYNWEHMDFSKRRATYVKGGDYTTSGQQIREALGMIDMSPNTQRAPHDRMLRSFGLYTLCVSNRQTFLDTNIPDAASFTYDFSREALQERISAVLANPSAAIDMGIAAAEAFRRDREPLQFAQYMVDTASHLRIAGGQRPPGLPDYFVWPPVVSM